MEGSSPRLWGTPVIHNHKTPSPRLIPTPVGNSLHSANLVGMFQVHPHACGELHLKSLITLVIIGSSPRLWGTLSLKYKPTGTRRFIPTPVGNSVERLIAHQKTQVHPHACGELFTPPRISSSPIGSSPRLWGTLFCFQFIEFHHRFIPTPVGNSPICGGKVRITQVHPHACGELTQRLTKSNDVSGSSPRLWGTRVQLLKSI